VRRFGIVFFSGCETLVQNILSAMLDGGVTATFGAGIYDDTISWGSCRCHF
jgi:hypothetical protein